MLPRFLAAVLGFTACSLALPAAGFAADIYGAVSAGASIHEAVDIDDGTGSDFETTAFPGFLLSGAAGLDFGLIRIEGEILYNRYELDDLEFAGADESADGGFSTLAGMANLFLDLPTPIGITPFVGGGVGYGEASANDIEFNGSSLLDDSDTGLVYQARAGLAFAILPLTDLTLGYRYLVIDGIDLSDGAVELEDDDLKSHVFELGLRISF